MLFKSNSVYEQHNKAVIDVIDVRDICADPAVKELCAKVRAATDESEQKRLKKGLPAIMASGKHVWLDVDGSNHADGNQEDIDFHSIAALIPHVLWFISASGKGMKILIKLNRDCDESERSDLKSYICTTIAEMTGLVVDDDSRLDITFASDSEVHYSHQTFPIPDVLEKTSVADKTQLFAFERDSMSGELYKLVEILRDYPERTAYKQWYGFVIAALSRYGVDAIPVLESKWESDVPYSTLLRHSFGKNSDFLDVLWNCRIVKNETYDRKRTHRRRTVGGAPGAGKSKLVIDEIGNQFSEPDDVYSNYVIYVVPSVAQAIAFAEKLKEQAISYEILVSKDTYEKAKPWIKSQLSRTSSNDTMVKIIQLASLMTGSYYKHVKREHRRLEHLYIDELTLTDFIRPSLAKSLIPRAFLGIRTDDDIHSLYEKRYSGNDYEYAKLLIENHSSNHFVSSILFQGVDTTVLSTEELTLCCLEQLGFERKTIRKKATEALAETCTLHLFESDDIILKFVQHKCFKSLIEEHGFENVFANRSEFATGNLMTIKGQHLPGKNLSVIRCLPQEVTGAIAELYSSCFNNKVIDPVALYYKDSLMQAVGRSVGFRGWTEGWVMVHPRVWSIIKDSQFIFKIQDWSVAIDPEFRRSRQQQKDSYKERDDERARFWKEEKAAKIKNRLIQTGNPNDKLTKEMLKLMFKKGVTLPDVAEVFNVTVKITKKGRYIEGFKSAI